MRRLLLWSLIGTLVAAPVAYGHPGHGATNDQSVVHYLVEPVHSLPLLLLAVGCAAGWYALRAARKRR